MVCQGSTESSEESCGLLNVRGGVGLLENFTFFSKELMGDVEVATRFEERHLQDEESR